MITISTRIPEGLDKQLALLARATDRKKGYLVRRALEYYVAEQKKARGTRKKKSGKIDPFQLLSYQKLVEIWDNDEDAVYDNL